MAQMIYFVFSGHCVSYARRCTHTQTETWRHFVLQEALAADRLVKTLQVGLGREKKWPPVFYPKQVDFTHSLNFSFILLRVERAIGANLC